MGDHNNASVTGNRISRTGMIIGMGNSGDESYVGLTIYGNSSVAQYNTHREYRLHGHYF